MKQGFESAPIVIQNSDDFLDRPRLHGLMETALHYSLAIVCAGSGYGKTRAVYSFLRGIDAHTTWVQLSEGDNVVTRFWENYAQMISLDWPEIGARLMEIGFPEAEDAFSKYMALRIETLPSPGKYVMVYDDFHLLHNPVVLRFYERVANGLPANVTVILISRTMPAFNITGLMLRERVFMIREEALCFTEAEISAYFKQLCLTPTRQNIREIYDDTRGWAFAINLIGRSLGKEQIYERYALEAMKKNIFRLIEAEISQSVSQSLWRFLLRISLIDHLAAELIRSLAKDDELIKDMERLNAYIRYDQHLDRYMIHHLFLDYLRQKQHSLTETEKRETYLIAGAWCKTHDHQADALSNYEKAGEWSAIIDIVYAFSFPVPRNMARDTLEIFSRAPEEASRQNPLYPAMMLKLKISLGLLDESSASARLYARDFETRPESPDKNRALTEIYGYWAYLRMILCPNTDVYDFDAYFEKQREYYDKNPYTAFGPSSNLPVGAYALLVGTHRAGAPEAYIEALSRAIPHVSHTLKGSMYGLDDLARGELSYFRRELNRAEQHLKLALNKAREKNQYCIQSRAMLYLMLMAISHGDMGGANALLRDMEALLNETEYATRYESYDIALSHYHLALGQPEQIPDWLKAGFSTYAHPSFIENYANRIKAQYHYLTRQYSTLLAFLKNVRESQTLLVGKIVFIILEAISLYQLKRKEEAILTLSEAYELAAPNRFIVPFIQFSKDMRTLAAATLKNETCAIPKEWLEDIHRKASAFAKRQSNIIKQYRIAHHIDDEISLTHRETEVLTDLSQGLSRPEIAASQNISINTVKMMINIIYDKLHVNSVGEAIRVATDRKII